MNNKVKMSGINNQLPSIDKIFKEDDDDFTPSVGSNLASIFGTPQKNYQENTRVNSNSPLRNSSAKKQSATAADENQSQTSSTVKKEVILAKAVHAFKLEMGKYVSIGKVGIALIGNTRTKQYDVILYKGTQNYISIVPITCEFSYTVQANNYASYYDSNKENWSILFEDTESSEKFSREICLSKYFTRTNNKIDNNVIYQDLSAAGRDASAAKEGDNISIKYLTSTDLSQPLKIDQNLKQTITLEISKDDNWERLLIGTSMGLKRIIILPSNKQIGLGPGFPKERDVIMEIEVISVFAKEDLPPQTQKPQEVSQKATIISRMAKMGQSILPKLPTSTTTDSEDTDEEVYHKTSRHKRLESGDTSAPKKHSYINQPSDVVSEKKVSNRGELMPATLPITQRSLLNAPGFSPQWGGQSQIQQQYVSVDGQLLPIQQQTFSQPISTSIDPTMNVFLSETRTQNTELRMGLSKISDNVQKLLDKFHVFELQQASTPAADKSLETTLKMFLDMNKSKQNAQSRDREIQVESKREEQASKNENLILINEQLNSRLSAIENELREANATISTKSQNIDELRDENDSLSQTNSILTNRVKQLEDKLSLAEIKSTELSDKLFNQSKEIQSEYEERNLKLENRITDLTNRCEGMEKHMWKSETSDWIDKAKEVKEIMNEIFQELCDSFSDDNYTTDNIKSTIHSTLRNITFKIVSEETEKKKEKSKRINKEEAAAAATAVSDQSSNENKRDLKSSKIDDNIEEDTESTDSNNIANSSELRSEPPPLPKFDLEETD